MKPLDLRYGPSWTNRTNKAKASSLPAILSWCNRFSHQQLISEFGEPTTEVHNFLFARDPTAIRGRREEHFLIGPMAAIFHQLRSSSQPL